MDIENEGYEPIKNHGVIGNLETIALVSKQGSIDWLCLPDFDSPSVFTGILDKEKGGFFQIKPAENFFSEQQYIDRTNILETTFHTDDHRTAKITDFMVPKSEHHSKETILIRKLEGIKGTIPISFIYDPKFDYARNEPTSKITGEGMLISQDKENTLVLKTDINIHQSENKFVEEFILQEGQTHWFILHYIPEYHKLMKSSQVSPIANASDELDKTKDFWENWCSKLNYEGDFKDEVIRSALLTKLLIHNPTGALINSPTMSLPETIAGHRNWDYRYVWLKDTAFAFHALTNLGCQEEAKKLFNWLENICIQYGRNIPPVVGLRGECSLIEHPLKHLSGYENSKPVNVGNNAYSQFELDSFCMILRCSLAAIKNNFKPNEQMIDILLDYADILNESWHNPDNSIWEVRDMTRQFTFSKVASCLGIGAGIDIANLTRPDHNKLQEWAKTKKEIYNQITERAWSEEKQSFTFHYHTEALDSSLLLMPILGFSDAKDEKIKSTVKSIRKELSTDSLIYRYNTSEYNDGINEQEGAYSTCSFWLAHSYSLIGDKDEAKKIIEHVLNYTHPLKIFSEEIDPISKDELGNYPHSPAHISFINAALSLK